MRRPALLFALLALLLPGRGMAGPAVPGHVDARAQRRAHLARVLGADYALVLGQPLTDVLQPRQEGHFLYLTGVDDPDASLLLAGADAPVLRLPRKDGEDTAREVLFLRYDNPRFARFFGLRYGPGPETEAALGIEATRAAPRGGKGLGERLARLLPADAHLRVPRYAGADHGLVREVRSAALAALAAVRPDVRVDDLEPELAAMRTRKDPTEIAALERAVAVTVEAFRDALPRIRGGSSEEAVDAVLLEGVRRRGAGPAYPFVVASGANGAIPHYFRNDAPLRDGDLLVIDAGAAWDRYAADVTRTFPVSGRFTPRQRECYDAVLRAQLAAIAEVRPGATLTDVHRAAAQVLSDAGLAVHFIHQTSHHVGLDVHDPMAQTLEPGMAITVEPGVYLADEGFGIRIEDVVLVTEDGARVLSAALPKDAEAVEALLARHTATATLDVLPAPGPESEAAGGQGSRGLPPATVAIAVALALGVGLAAGVRLRRR